MVIGRRAAAQKNKQLGCPKPMPCSGRDENRITGRNFPGDPFHFHQASPAGDIVELLTYFVIVPLDFRTGVEACFRKTLVPNRSVRQIQQAANRGPVLGGERDLLLTVPNFHAVRKPPMLPECNARIRREWRLPKKRRRTKRSAADGTGDAGGARPGLPGPRLPRGPPGGAHRRGGQFLAWVACGFNFLRSPFSVAGVMRPDLVLRRDPASGSKKSCTPVDE